MIKRLNRAGLKIKSRFIGEPEPESSDARLVFVNCSEVAYRVFIGEPDILIHGIASFSQNNEQSTDYMSAVKKLIFETKKILFCIINVRDILIFIVQNAEN